MSKADINNFMAGLTLHYSSEISALLTPHYYFKSTSRAVKPIISDQLCILWMKNEICMIYIWTQGATIRYGTTLAVTSGDLQSEGHCIYVRKYDFPKSKGRNKCYTSFRCDFDSIWIHSWLFVQVIFNNSRSSTRSKGKFQGQKCQNMTFNENNYRYKCNTSFWWGFLLGKPFF